MFMRWPAGRWVLGAIGVASVLTVACSSGSSDAGGDALTSDIASSSAGDSGDLVTDSSTGVMGDGGAWLGAATVPVPDLLAGLLGLGAGERIGWVTSGGPADGVLIIGDTISALNGSPIDSENGVADALGSLDGGESVALTVQRGDETLELQVTLGTKPVHPEVGSLAGVQGLLDRAITGEFTFLDTVGMEHTVALATGTLSGVTDGRVSLTRPGSGPITEVLSPNVFVWIDGTPGTARDLTAHIEKTAKIVSLDDVTLAVLVGGIIPPALEALEGFLGVDGVGLPGALGALEQFQGLFGELGAPLGE